MLTKAENERLTRVGPGTPGGELLRRYWQPLCPAGELTAERPRKRIRMLGEDLIVFRTPDGDFACMEEFCKHRRASLFYGFLEPDGMRCCYHGWKYDFSGKCTDIPFQPDGSKLKEGIKLKAYPVRRLGGILFVYMGPDPAKAPLLPRWDVLVREDGNRVIQVLPIHRCNWLQVQENTADSAHTFYLHGMTNQVHGLNLQGAEYYMRPIVSLDWKPCQWGIDKTIVYGGDNPETEIRPPLIFPNVLRIPQGPVECMHWRVPVDDTHTRIVWVGLIPPFAGGKPMKESVDPPYEYLPEPFDENGDYKIDSFYFQDQMVMETQGAIFDRSQENLSVTDRGIVMFRNMLSEQIDIVEKGGEPTVAVVTDPAKNDVIAFTDATSPGGSVELSFVR